MNEDYMSDVYRRYVNLMAADIVNSRVKSPWMIGWTPQVDSDVEELERIFKLESPK